MNAQHRREWDYVRKFSTESWEIKNMTKSTGGRGNRCEDGLSDLQDRAEVKDQSVRDTPREHEKWNRQLSSWMTQRGLTEEELE